MQIDHVFTQIYKQLLYILCFNIWTHLPLLSQYLSSLLFLLYIMHLDGHSVGMHGK